MKRGRILLPLSLILILGIIALTLAIPTVNALFLSTPIPTQEYLWAYAEVAKPTHTPTPLILAMASPTPLTVPTDTPSPEPTTSESSATLVMEIIEDTPTPIYEPEQSVPISFSGGTKYILVDISEQHMYVYEGDTLIYSFVASTGMNNSTRVGTFAVQSKIPNAYGATWNIWMPYWLGIYWSGGLENGIHGLPILPNGATLWEGYLGRPVSYGCVVLGTYEASLLYDWAQIGTTVEIRW
ncbi:MAG TPA: L,D-transpeptidase [Anaerolineales bacterium]|nr:L,D-transpeptidase [Anaerolineales bacterium]